MGYVELAARVLVGTVLLLAALGKLRSPTARADLVRTLRTVPGVGPRWASRAAAAVIAVEASVGGLVLVPATSRGGAVLAAGLLAVFTAGTGWLVHRRVEASCSCFGGAGAALRGAHVFRNALLTAAAVLPAATGRVSGLERSGLVIAVVTGFVLAQLVSRWDDLAALVRSDPPAPTARVTNRAGH